MNKWQFRRQIGITHGNENELKLLEAYLEHK